MVERRLESVIFWSRWLMAPLYVGLIVTLGVLIVKFAQELLHLLTGVLTLKPGDFIPGILSLIDLSLAGNLLLIVIFSGYENFVSKLDIGEHADRPAWMGTVDFAGMKLKLIASIVAISAIDLLKTFMNIDHVSDREVMWQLLIHLGFIASGVGMALMDWIVGRANPEH
jgi:uncharacterized protein (TIGR00645 family)